MKYSILFFLLVNLNNVSAQIIEIRYLAHISRFSSSILENDTLLVNLSNAKTFNDNYAPTFLKQVPIFKQGNTLINGNYFSSIDTIFQSYYHSEFIKIDSIYFTIGNIVEQTHKKSISAYYIGANKKIDSLHYIDTNLGAYIVRNIIAHPLKDSSVLIVGSFMDTSFQRSAFIMDFNLFTEKFQVYLYKCSFNGLCNIHDIMYDKIQNNFISVTGMPLGPNPFSISNPAFAYFDENFKLDTTRSDFIELSHTPYFGVQRKTFQINVAMEWVNDSTIIVAGDIDNPSVLPGGSGANSIKYGDDIGISLRKSSDFTEFGITKTYGKRDTGETQDIGVDLFRKMDSNLYVIATTLDKNSQIESWNTELSLLGINAKGEKHWIKYIPFNDYCYALEMHLDQKGGLWVISQCTEDKTSGIDWFVKVMYIDSVAYWPRIGQTVGISEKLSNWDRDFRISPNPASENVIIRQYGKLQVLDAGIYDPNGRLVKEIQLDQMDNVIDLSELSPGLYFVRISFNGEYLNTEKLMLN